MPSNRTDFAELFRANYAHVYRYVRYRVSDDKITEDLTADIFERAYRYRDNFDPGRGTFSTWITQIAHNWVNNYLVSQQRRERYEGDETEDIDGVAADEPHPEEAAILSEAVQRLLWCLDHLSTRDRQIVALRFGTDTRNKDIAELLGLKEHTVSVILLRALERLRGCQEEVR